MILKLYTLLILLKFITSNKKEICNDINSSDDVYSQIVLLNHLPFGFVNKTNIIHKIVKLDEWDECIKYCCDYKQCDAVLFNTTHCKIIHCKNPSLCQPVKEKTEELFSLFLNISVNSGKHERKEEEEKDENDDNENEEEKEMEEDDENRKNGKFKSSLKYKIEIDEGISSCELGIASSCKENQICQQIQEDRRSGVCLCDAGYIRNGDDCVYGEHKKRFNQTKMKTTKIVPIKTSRASTTNISRTFSSTIKMITTEFKRAKETNTESQQLIASAGPDLNIDVLKSSLLDKPVVVLIQGMATISNRTVSNKLLSYYWKRLPQSIAAGTIVNNSQNKSTLMLTNLIQGQYWFELTVTYYNGDTAKDLVKLNVTEIEDEIDRNLIKIVLQINVYKFSEQKKENFSKWMAHVIEKHFSYSHTGVEIHSVLPDKQNNTQIMFYARKFNKTTNRYEYISSGLLERNLKKKLLNHKFIFHYSVKSFQSLFCHDDCGGHGVCDQNTHRCKCSLPWFNDAFTEHNTGFSNCSMHVMIVVAACAMGIFFLVIFFILCKKLLRKCRLRSKYGKKILQYRLLDDTDS